MKNKIKIQDKHLLFNSNVFGNNTEVKIDLNNILFENSSYCEIPDDNVIKYIKENLNNILSYYTNKDLHISSSNSGENYVYCDNNSPYRFTFLLSGSLYEFQIKITNTGQLRIKDLTSMSIMYFKNIKADILNLLDIPSDIDYKKELLNYIQELK